MLKPGKRFLLRMARNIGEGEILEVYPVRRSGAIVLVDIVMPEKDGIETVRDILAIDPAAVIFTMSGRDGAGDYQEVARRLGAKRGFEKPLNLEALMTRIESTLYPGHSDGA